jgi:hypothetical protein
MASYTVDNYAVRQWSSRSTGLENTGIPITGIYLYEGDERRGQIYFYPDGLELRPPAHNADKNQIMLSFGMCQFQGTVAMLERGLVRIFYNSISDSGIASVRLPQLAWEIGEAALEVDGAVLEVDEAVPQADEAAPKVDEAAPEADEAASIDVPE